MTLLSYKICAHQATEKKTSILFNFLDQISRRSDLSAIGNQLVGILKSHVRYEWNPEKKDWVYNLFWWCATIMENEENWETPSAFFTTTASEGYNNMGGSYRRYSLGGGTPLNFPEFGDHRLFFNGSTACIAGIRAIVSPYFFSEAVQIWLHTLCADRVKRYVADLAKVFSWQVIYFSGKELPGDNRTDTRTRPRIRCLIVNGSQVLNHLSESKKTAFTHIISYETIPPFHQYGILPEDNITRIYRSPRRCGEELAIVIPQKHFYDQFVLQQQWGGAISEVGLKFFTYLSDNHKQVYLINHGKYHAIFPAPCPCDEPGPINLLSGSYATRLLSELQKTGTPGMANRFDPGLAKVYTEMKAATMKRVMAFMTKEKSMGDENRFPEGEYRALIKYVAMLRHLWCCLSREGAFDDELKNMENYQSQRHFDSPPPPTESGRALSSTLLFECAMAATSAISDFLIKTHKAEQGPLVVGKNLYTENAWLLDFYFKNQIFRIDEKNPEAILAAIGHHNPRVLFFEAITNNFSMNALPVEKIIKGISALSPARTRYLVIDMTAVGNTLCQKPICKEALPRHLTLIFIESLQKFYQRGMDITSGGALHLLSSDRQAVSRLANELKQIRTLNDTGIKPYGLFKFSAIRPDNAELKAKIERHTQNTRCLHRYICQLSHPFLGRITPLDNIPCSYGFGIPYFWIQPGINTYCHSRLLLFSIIAFGKKNRVCLQDRDSFYFGNTVLHISRRTYQGLRIAPGMETKSDMERLKKTIAQALDLSLYLSTQYTIKTMEKDQATSLIALITEHIATQLETSPASPLRTDRGVLERS